MTLILSGTEGVSDVDGSAATPAVRGADANTGIFFPAADTIAFAEGGTEVARITNTGAWSFGSSGTATGTSGQALVSGGSGAAPAWGTLAAAGGGTGLTAPGTSGNVLTSNGTAWTSTAPAVTAPAGTTGQVQINSAGAFGAVSEGTTGQVLTSQGTGAAPVFSTPSTGAMVFLQAVTASGSSTVELTAFSNTYDDYFITYSDILLSATNQFALQYRFGTTYVTAFDYTYASHRLRGNDSAYQQEQNTGSANVLLSSFMVTDAERGSNGFIKIIGANNSKFKSVFYETQSFGNSFANYVRNLGFGILAGLPTYQQPLTGIRFLIPAAGTITTGTFRLYGIAKS